VTPTQDQLLPMFARADRRLVVSFAASLVLLVGVTAALVGSAGPARAHATLVEAAPSDGAALEGPPPAVVLTFSEPVTAADDAVRVFDADAVRVDLGAVDPHAAGRRVAAALPDDLSAGGYVVTYRVTSVDSHVVAGVLRFTVGDAPPVGDALVAELFGGAGRGTTGVLGPLLRGLGYLATLLAGGAVAFAAAVVLRRADRRRSREVGRAAALAGIVVALVALPVQAAAVTGAGPLAALVGSGVAEVLATSFGVGTLVRVAGLVGLALLWRPAADRGGTALALPGLAGAIAVASFALDGHQQSVGPTALLVAADAVHVWAAALWLAGVVLLAGMLRRPTRRAPADDPVPLAVTLGTAPPARSDGAPPAVTAAASPPEVTEQRPLPATGDSDVVTVAATVVRFSSLALLTVVAVAASGAAMAIVLVRTPAALVSSAYGWTLLAKLAVVALVVVLATFNRTRLVPAVAGRAERDGTPAAWRQLATTVRIEAGLLAVVLLVTGFLVSQPPAVVAAATDGPVQASAPLADGLTVDLVVDPGSAGRNALHVYVLEPTGQPSDRVDELWLELTFVPADIGPIERELFPVEPGHWTGIVDDLTFAGTWQVRVVAMLDRFEQVRVDLPVTLAP
jgi:copper transport protein